MCNPPNLHAPRKSSGEPKIFHALAVFNLWFDALVAFCIARVWFHVLVLVAACEISNILQVHFPFLFTSFSFDLLNLPLKSVAILAQAILA